MTDSQKIDAYLIKHSNWSQELIEIRSIFSQTNLREEVKWGSPTYTLNGKLIAGMAAFKNHLAIWFHQGVFLNDHGKKLVNAQEGVTRGLRQWRFNKGDVIEGQLILEYIQEAIENCNAGKEIKPKRNKEVTIPPYLKEAFKNDSNLLDSFKNLTPGRQREFAEYMREAKRITTKERRLQKIIPLILAKRGLHDTYKKC